MMLFPDRRTLTSASFAGICLLLTTTLPKASPSPGPSIISATDPARATSHSLERTAAAKYQVKPEPGCIYSANELKMASLLLSAQKNRKHLECSPKLQLFAKERVRDMADRQYFAHVTPERVGPNEALKTFGYPLPDIYVGGLSNSIESIARGEEEPAELWEMLIDSPSHRAHLLGLGTFFARQVQFGIAETTDKGGEPYWAIIIARPATESDPRLLCEPAPGGCRRLHSQTADK